MLTSYSDVNVVVNNKLVKFPLKLYCISFNDSYQRQTRIAQKRIQIICPEFTKKDQWAVASRCAWTMDYHVWDAMFSSSTQNPNQSPRCFILIDVFSICVNCGRLYQGVYLYTWITGIQASIPGFDYTRLEPCMYWIEEDTNNNKSTTELKEALNCRWSGTACHRNRSTRLLKASYYDWRDA